MPRSAMSAVGNLHEPIQAANIARCSFTWPSRRATTQSAPGFSKALERAWSKQQERLVSLEPGARQIIAKQSEHYIMLEQPDLVVTAIREVVDAVPHGSKQLRANGLAGPAPS